MNVNCRIKKKNQKMVSTSNLQKIFDDTFLMILYWFGNPDIALEDDQR